MSTRLTNEEFVAAAQAALTADAKAGLYYSGPAAPVYIAVAAVLNQLRRTFVEDIQHDSP